MEKWNLVIDVAKCEACNNCLLACKDEHEGNDFPPYAVAQPRHGHYWIDILTKERGQHPDIDVANLPVPCMHCDDAPCRKKSGDAIEKMANGIVIIDPVNAKDKKEIVNACPYQAIYWNEEKDVAQKCTFCAHLLADGWKEPRCVQACPTGALRAVKAEDAAMQQLITQEKLEVLHPEFKTRPRVYYKNLYRYTQCFIAGDVAFKKDSLVDCAEGALVTLLKDGQKVGEVTADNYGDFKFDKLEPNSGCYTLEVAFKGYAKKSLVVEVTESRSVGTILFA